VKIKMHLPCLVTINGLKLIRLLCFCAVALSFIPRSVQAQDPFATYLSSVPTVVSNISSANSGSGASAITTRRFTFSSRNGTNIVFAILAYPQLAGAYPGIMWLHGGGSDAEAMAGNVATFAARGYVCIAIDQPSIAGTDNTPYSSGPWKFQTGGDAPKFNVTGGPQNCSLVDAEVGCIEGFNLLKAQSNVIPTKMGISGSSWGGYSTTMLAGLLGTNVTAVYSQYGCGFYDKGSAWSATISNMPTADRNVWLTYFDAGRRAPNMTAAYL